MNGGVKCTPDRRKSRCQSTEESVTGMWKGPWMVSVTAIVFKEDELKGMKSWGRLRAYKSG